MSLQFFLGVEAETALYSLLVPSEPNLSIYFHLNFFCGTYLSFPFSTFVFIALDLQLSESVHKRLQVLHLSSISIFQNSMGALSS